MKNKIIIAALAVLTVVAFSIPATAGDLDANYGNVQFAGTESMYDLSNRVYIDYSIDNDQNAQKFGSATVHSAGDRVYATTSETSVIWYKTVTKGTANPGAGIDETWTTGDFDGAAEWKSL